MNKTQVKRSLLASLLALVLCVAMFASTTYAWFTDTASTGINKITSGNLDVKLEYSKDCATWANAEGATEIFSASKWEPGYTEVVYFKVTNAGSLAFNYKVAPDVNEEVTGLTKDGKTIKLSNYLQFGIVEATAKFATRDAARAAITSPKNFSEVSTASAILGEGASQIFAMVVWMPEETGDEANHDGKNIPSIPFTVTVVASQATSENDSYDNQYDKDAAEEPKVATVATAKELQAILTQFTDAGSGNTTINISDDITLAEGEVWTPVKIDGYNGAGVVTINGNGHTISGLTDTLLAGGFAGNSGIIINDLTIANANITSSNSQGYGAFINCVDSMPKIELNNCHLVNSTITDTKGARVGGLIGWSAGYNNPNNGPVDTYININRCSVTGCTITAAGSVGAIIGHAGNNPATYHTITNCVVENNILTSNDDSYRVGAIVGTANVGEVTITGCTSTGNTMLQNNAGTEIARPEGQSDLYGRFVPGTTGKLTIDGSVIN